MTPKSNPSVSKQSVASKSVSTVVSTELQEMQRAVSRLGAWRQELIDWKREYARVMTTLNGMIGNLGKRINDIKSGTDEIITDHALIRYLERYEEYDLDSLRDKVRNLPDTKKTVINNNIITVGDNLPPVKEERLER